MQTRKNTQQAENQIFKAIDILRSSGQPLESYDLIFFFLLMKKQGWLDKIVIDDLLDFYRQIPAIASEDHSKNGKAFLDVFSQFAKDLDDLGYDIKYRLVVFFKNYSLQPNDSYGELYELLFNKVKVDLAGKASGEFYQPEELSRLMASIYSLKPDAKVYNPFAGSASIATYLPSNVSYYGQEIVTKSWALGQMRLIVHDKLDRAQVVKANSVSDWGFERDRYDFIVANAPFNYKVLDLNSIKRDSLEDGYADTLFIRNSLRTLNENGKAVLVVPNGFLFRSSNAKLREYLVDNDLLDVVISFPGSILPHTGIPFTLIGISLSKANKGKVHFINAENLVSKEGRKNYIRVEEILKCLIDQQDTEISRLVEIKEIRDEGYNLSVNRYIYEEVENGVPLEEFLTIYFRRGRTTKRGGKYIRISELKSDPNDRIIDLESLSTKQDVPGNSTKIHGRLLLISLRFLELKPSIINITEGESVYKSNDVAAFYVDEQKVILDYLILELHSDHVRRQLDRYRRGATMPYISKEDFLKVKIRLPYIQEQAAKVEGYRAASTDKLNQVKDRVYRVKEEEERAAENRASIEHILGRPLSGLYSAFMNLQDIISDNAKSNSVTTPDTYIHEGKKITVGSTFASIKKELEFIFNIIKSNDGDIKNDYDMSPINIVSFIKNYVAEYKRRANQVAQINCTVHPIIEKEFNNSVEISGNEDLLKIAFDAIIDNAELHAFGKKSNPSNDIGINILPNQIGKSSEVAIWIGNNGNPFPTNFTKQDYIRKNSYSGKNANTGIGGYHVYQAVKKLGGNLELLLFEDLHYISIIELMFPIVQTNAELNEEEL